MHARLEGERRDAHDDSESDEQVTRETNKGPVSRERGRRRQDIEHGGPGDSGAHAENDPRNGSTGLPKDARARRYATT